MQITFKTFRSGIGDCIFMLLVEGETSFHIMVDCGRYTNVVQDYIRNTLRNRIDLLVVTHIDADHIEGVTKMLLNNPGLEIEEIWFNSYNRALQNETIQLSENQTNCLRRLYSKIPPVIDVLDTHINAEQAMTLSETILSNPRWKQAWKRERIVRGIPDYNICGGELGTIRILSPMQRDLDKLDDQFFELFYEFFYSEHPDMPLDKDTSIFELLLRIAEERSKNEAFDYGQIAAQLINNEYIRDCCTHNISTISLANQASIAFEWVFRGHRILFLGDADPAIIFNNLDRDQTMYDIVKVSHHGSAHSTSTELMRKIDAKHFFFTGGYGDLRPHIDSISRIINRVLPIDLDSRILHFNYVNKWTGALNKDEIMREFNFRATFTENELTYEI